MASTTDEIFDGLDALPFEEQAKRFLRVFRQHRQNDLTADPRFLAWLRANKGAMVEAHNSGLRGRLQNEISRELGEPANYWEGDDAP